MNKTIKNIGGGVAYSYMLLENCIDEIDNKNLDLLKNIGLATNKEEYLHYALCGKKYVLEDRYIKLCYNKMIENGKIKKTRCIPTKLKEQLQKKFELIFRKYGCLYNCLHCYNKVLIQTYNDALFFDENIGLRIDNKKFLSINKNIAKSKESEFYDLHIKACKAINDFFKGIYITPELLNIYFVISEGKVKVDENSLKNCEYRRLIM